MKKTLERRLELLKMEAVGFSQSEIVKELSKKYHKTERMIYYDFETRRTWQPLFSQLFDRAKASLVMLNRLEFIYRKASLEGDYKSMLDTTKATIEFLGLTVNDLGEKAATPSFNPPFSLRRQLETLLALKEAQ